MTGTTQSAGSANPLAITPALIARLFIGGFVGLMVWEVWARFITAWIIGGPLEPSGLVISLSKAYLGWEPPKLAAEAAHYVIGIVGYPVAYYIISRFVPRWPVLLDALVWVAFTIFLAMKLVGGGLTTFSVVFWLIVTGVKATRFFNPNTLVADCLSWGSFTWFNALGIMAPLADLPFLLMDWGGSLSFMSYVGHVIYGFITAYVFERWQGRS